MEEPLAEPRTGLSTAAAPGPARLGTFLADAHRWEVLRQLGAHYRFRHDTLLRHLKEHHGRDRSARTSKTRPVP
ncbi:hypothetical protein ACFO4E_25130 [Nocardiopsis mangrovi]|uniref:Winged helix-turn helix domain-containing protein n=1 Tax=Nocardiopsis mangrovi TaxID=1179818 RepID=A0ABV9E6A5_9ACTN